MYPDLQREHSVEEFLQALQAGSHSKHIFDKNSNVPFEE